MHAQYFDRMHKHVLLVDKIKGMETMDAFGDYYSVRIPPPLATSKMRSQAISCQTIRDWQIKD